MKRNYKIAFSLIALLLTLDFYETLRQLDEGHHLYVTALLFGMMVLVAAEVWVAFRYVQLPSGKNKQS